jgi:hypothetical protein
MRTGGFGVCWTSANNILAEAVGAVIVSPGRIMSGFRLLSHHKSPQDSPQTDQLAFVNHDRAQRTWQMTKSAGTSEVFDVGQTLSGIVCFKCICEFSCGAT